MERPAGLAAYVPPAIGFDVVAIIGATAYPRDLAGMTAPVAAVACRRAGLDDDALGELLGDARSALGDVLLEQGAPAGAVTASGS